MTTVIFFSRLKSGPGPSAAGVDKELLMKVELLEAQDLCLATLEGHERLDYAKGTGDTGSSDEASASISLG